MSETTNHNHKHGQKQVAGFVTFGIATAGLVLGIIDACNVSTIQNSYLRRDGSIPMTGDLNMDGHGFKNLFYLTLVNSSSAPTPGSNLTNFFSTGGGNLTQIDENGTTYTYLTQTPQGDFLPRDGSKPMFGHLDMGNNAILNQTTLLYLDGSAAMTGDLNMGGFNIVNLGLLSTKASNNNVVFGSGTTVNQPANQSNILLGVNQVATGNLSTLLGDNLTSTGSSNVMLGASSSITGSFGICIDTQGATLTGTNIISIGRANTVSDLGNVVVGRSNSIVAGSTSNVMYGSTNQVIASGSSSNAICGSTNVIHATTFNCGAFGFNNSVTGTRAYVWGANNTINATNAFLIGNTSSNVLDNTIALGDVLTAIYPVTDNTVNVGLTASRFKNAYLTNNCYLSGLPTPICEFSSSAESKFQGDNAEHTYSTVSHVGTLTLPPMQVGGVVRITVNFLLQYTSGATDAIHLYLNNTTSNTKLLSPFIPIPDANLNNIVGQMVYTMTIRDAITAFAIANGFLQTVANAAITSTAQGVISFNSNISNTLSLIGQFDTGTSAIFKAEQIIIESLFKTA